MKLVKNIFVTVSLCAAGAVSLIQPLQAAGSPAGDAGQGHSGFLEIPSAWKWISDRKVAFTYDGTYADSSAFSFDARSGKILAGVTSREKCRTLPVHPEGAVNMTWSPDSSMIAFTRDNDLYVADVSDGREVRLTFDGSDLILNGYASWVYYEEIFGRQTNYRAFWWSPDGSRIGFYRFDNSRVPLFPIYSPSGQDGKLRNTRYPKAGEPNPEVRIGIADVRGAFDGNGGTCSGNVASVAAEAVVWADFSPHEDQYFGTPFWSSDGSGLFVSRMPRLQNTLDLYRVDASDGSKKHIYHEEYPTWLDWIGGMIFGKDGLYMARSFETGWEQIYFLSYDGSELRRLTEGENWNISLLRADEKKGDVYFTADRGASLRQTLYKVDRNGKITALTDPVLDVKNVQFSPDGKYFAAALSNSVTPTKVAVCDMKGHKTVVADMAYPGYSPEDFFLPEIIWLEMEDGLSVPGAIVYPEDFDPSERYPVHVDIYGGPDTPMVRDRWVTPSGTDRWWAQNGIIRLTADCRASGHNGRAGLDKIYRQLTVCEVKDFVRWAEWLQSLPYVRPDKIGVEGFSFGGTMTAMLLMQAPEYFHYGVAGGGVYDWSLYDSHYTERYMDTPQNNPGGYRAACVLNYAEEYPAEYPAGDEDGCSPCQDSTAALRHCPEPVMLKLTHGTGDDNVHFQNTLQLVDTLQKAGKKFELMIYPDGMHGYRGAQKEHFDAANREFWLKYLKGE